VLADDVEQAEIRLSNSRGKFIMKYEIANGSSSIVVDCSRYRNGVYTYSLVIKGNVVDTRKMVIAR
jgi:hypothetical protein